MARGENCARGQCCCAHSLGREENGQKRPVSPAGPEAAQDPAGASAPFRNEHPQQVGNLRVCCQRQADHTFAFHLERGFQLSQEPRTNLWTTMVKWGRREGRKSGDGVDLGFGKPHDGQGGRQNRRLVITAPQHPGEHSSLLRQFTALTPSPSGRLAGLQTGYRKSVVSIIHSTLCV